MVKAKKATAPAPPDQNVVSCLFSKRHVKIEKTASEDDHEKPPPPETQEPPPIVKFTEAQEPAQETQEHVEETQEPAQEPEHKNAKASLGPIREDPIT